MIAFISLCNLWLQNLQLNLPNNICFIHIHHKRKFRLKEIPHVSLMRARHLPCAIFYWYFMFCFLNKLNTSLWDISLWLSILRLRQQKKAISLQILSKFWIIAYSRRSCMHFLHAVCMYACSLFFHKKQQIRTPCTGNSWKFPTKLENFLQNFFATWRIFIAHSCKRLSHLIKIFFS